MDLRLAARTCLAALGEFARALALGREAEPLAKALDDPRREALIHCSVSIALTLMGRSTEAIEPGKRAMAIAEALQEPTLCIAARYSMGLPHVYLGAYRTVIDCFQRDVGLTSEEIPARLLQPWGGGSFSGILYQTQLFDLSERCSGLLCGAWGVRAGDAAFRARGEVRADAR